MFIQNTNLNNFPHERGGLSFLPCLILFNYF